MKVIRTEQFYGWTVEIVECPHSDNAVEYVIKDPTKKVRETSTNAYGHVTKALHDGLIQLLKWEETAQG